jgi:hypothetical protein
VSTSLPCAKGQLKIFKYLNVSSEPLKLIEGNTGRMLRDLGNGLLNRTPIAQKIARIDKFISINLERVCTANGTINMKRQPTKWKKIFVRYSSDRGLISKI